jgi:hypothetical protein
MFSNSLLSRGYVPCNSRPGRDNVERDRGRHVILPGCKARSRKRGQRVEQFGKGMLFVGESPNGRVYFAQAGMAFARACLEFDAQFPPSDIRHKLRPKATADA